ncbi:hypothetical protein AALP_AA4G060000 [Arabis alpina]|uniref:F-box domain-containing protein n=1 Tax=Arabis alpina TaxID=50452 RepID=A0A087H1F4_ARAAL|nr:hypothetical protein AALP_AA4G060000 [Arabis alpina]
MPMETRSRRRRAITTFPDAILVEILARLPLRIITRFKSVCKTWKSVTESAYFRRVFLSLHKSSSSSWSLMFPNYHDRPIAEAIGFYGSKTWALPKSLGSYILPLKPYPNLPSLDCFYRGSSNGLVLIEVSIKYTGYHAHDFKTFVGNPVLQQWFEITPPPKRCIGPSLITSVDEDGVVSSFKVVMTDSRGDSDKDIWNVYVYSSETGLWSFKRLICTRPVRHLVLTYYPPQNVIGKYYLWERDSSPTDPGILLAYDFYDPEEAEDRCRVIPLPVPGNRRGKRCVTTSEGDVIFIQLLSGRLKVWKLNDNNNSESSECWQLLWEINMVSLGFDVVDCFPMGMNLFDIDVVYLWSHQHCCLVSGNLKTQNFIVHWKSKDRSSKKGCYLYNTRDSKRYMERLYEPPSIFNDSSRILMLSQFVLPQWMDSVPRPPN